MKNYSRKGVSFQLRATAVAVAACFTTGLALANPTGPAVVNGSATVMPMGNVLQITNTPNTIINWQGFSISPGELTRFLQQSASSAVLNRVVTANPSTILGALQSNGRVFLINPNGILFGPGSFVDVAGLVASSLNLSDADFLSGRMRFTEVPGAGAVVNQGTIGTTPGTPGAHVYLVGPAVTNGGLIASPQGEVVLAAGNSVELVNPGTPNLSVEITAPDNQALNLGMILADSGRVGIYAGLINQSGVIQANSAVATPDGRIVLKATDTATFGTGSSTMAFGPTGGLIEVDAGNVIVSGSVSSGTQNINATGDITVDPGGAGFAVVNASGPQTVTAGGGLRVQTTSGGNAQLSANGGQTINAAFVEVTGDGGSASISNFGSSGQTVNVGGTLTLQGASSGSNRSALLISNGNQDITAGNLMISGGAGGSSNTAQIGHAAGGNQTVTVTGGGTLAIQGGTSGSGNIARIRNNSGNQTIAATGGTIVVSGGGSGPTDDGNFARIEGPSPGMQTVNAHSIAINGGAAGTNNYAGIQAAHQVITTTGDVNLTGGAGTVTGARIGGFGTGNPTDLALNVGGNLTLTGGGETDASLGSNQFGGVHTDIAVTAAGNITLNPGTSPGADARIGSPDIAVGDGNISLTTLGGNIALNSAPGAGTSFIQTLGDVTLQANAITQGAESSVRANQVIAMTNTGTGLGGANQIAAFNATGGFIDGVTLNNASPLLTVNGISTFGGPLTLQQAGDLAIRSNVFSGVQSIAATGDITLTPGTFGNANVFAIGPQTVNAGGTLNVLGAPDGMNRFVQFTTTGDQNIAAAGINITGGNGVNNFAQINHQPGSIGNQTITVTGGGTLAIQGGTTGTDNVARIRNDGGDQTIDVNGGAIMIAGGGSAAADTGNFARIEGRNAGMQTVNAHSIAINGGAAGTNNYAGIQAAHQVITTTGDVNLTGGAGTVTGARIGGFGTGNPTDLALNVGGNLTLTGGAETDASLGSNQFGGVRTDIVVTAAGNITLNPGTSPGADARIGSPDIAVGDGNISLTSLGGNIALNSAPGAGTSFIQTLGDVTLQANAITQGAESSVRANQLMTTTSAGTSLGGNNQVAVFNASNDAIGGVTFNNISPLLTVTGISTAPGPVTLTQDGSLAVTGSILSGPQSFSATGDMVVGSDSDSVVLYAAGPADAVSAGSPNASLRAMGVGLLDRIAGHAPVDISARSLSIQGGSAPGSFAAITGGPINITTTGGPATGDLSLTGGSGLGAFSWLLSSQDINLNVGGNLRLDAGTGLLSFARMQTVRPGSVINVFFPNLSSGGYFVNGDAGYRDALSGFYSGPAPAKPEKRLITTYGQ